LQPYKGHSYLVEACKQLQQRGIPFRCRIIGEGEKRQALERKIQDAGLMESVQLLGAKSQEEVSQLLPTAHCYVQPSIVTSNGKMEGIPVSIMEAFACSLPVVATHLSGIPEIVRSGKTGYLTPPADADALADALETVYKSPNESKRLAENGHQLVLDEFKLTNNVSKLIQLFEQYLLPKKLDAQMGLN
jgi:glycosyltransferase involved in cell wall biosynthesis